MKTEFELRESNERFTLASQASSEALWEWNVLTGEAYISPAYTHILGWMADEFNKFEEWHDYIHPDDKKVTIEAYYRALNDPKVEKWEQEYRYLKADGSFAFVFDKAIILRDEEGRAIKVVGALQDVTKQKIAEEELRRSNERFLLASKAASDAIYEWDIINDIIHWGEGLQTLFGIIPLQFSISRLENLIHPKDRRKFSDSLYGALSDPTQSFWKEEYRLKKEDRRYSHVLDRGFIIRNETGKAIRMKKDQ
jgi:PAS domain S-box-containing protein